MPSDFLCLLLAYRSSHHPLRTLPLTGAFLLQPRPTKPGSRQLYRSSLYSHPVCHILVFPFLYSTDFPSSILGESTHELSHPCVFWNTLFYLYILLIIWPDIGPWVNVFFPPSGLEGVLHYICLLSLLWIF